MPRRERLYLAIYVFILAPIGAVVAVCAMLLFGVKPHTVFAVGFAIKSIFGPHVPNAVAVIGTVGTWWLAIVVVGLIWEVMRHKSSRPHRG